MTHLRAVLLVAVAGAMLCGTAEASPKPRPLGSAVGSVYSDGSRYVAFMASDEVMRVYDMRTRNGYSLRTTCTPADGAYGRFLLRCGPAHRILRARSGRSHAVQVPESVARSDFYRMGRHWLRGEDFLGDLTDATFLNWRNGSMRRGIEELEADLDRRRFRRKASDLGNRYGGSSGARDLYCREHGTRYVLELRHPLLVLERDRGSCPLARLRRGVATWQSSGHVYAHILRTGRTYRWRGFDPTHTRHWIAFTRQNGRVLYARLK